MIAISSISPGASLSDWNAPQSLKTDSTLPDRKWKAAFAVESTSVAKIVLECYKAVDISSSQTLGIAVMQLWPRKAQWEAM